MWVSSPNMVLTLARSMTGQIWALLDLARSMTGQIWALLEPVYPTVDEGKSE